MLLCHIVCSISSGSVLPTRALRPYGKAQYSMTSIIILQWASAVLTTKLVRLLSRYRVTATLCQNAVNRPKIALGSWIKLLILLHSVENELMECFAKLLRLRMKTVLHTVHVLHFRLKIYLATLHEQENWIIQQMNIHKVSECFGSVVRAWLLRIFHHNYRPKTICSILPNPSAAVFVKKDWNYSRGTAAHQLLKAESVAGAWVIERQLAIPYFKAVTD